MTETEQEIPLTPTEQVVSKLHDRWVAGGMSGVVAARKIRAALKIRATAVVLSEEFWAWLTN